MKQLSQNISSTCRGDNVDIKYTTTTKVKNKFYRILLMKLRTAHSIDQQVRGFEARTAHPMDEHVTGFVAITLWLDDIKNVMVQYH